MTYWLTIVFTFVPFSSCAAAILGAFRCGGAAGLGKEAKDPAAATMGIYNLAIADKAGIDGELDGAAAIGTPNFYRRCHLGAIQKLVFQRQLIHKFVLMIYLRLAMQRLTQPLAWPSHRELV